MDNPRALFLGLTTLDLLYTVDTLPRVNEKMTARDQFVAAGGPATNAAVAFSFLGGSATLASTLGSHPLGQLVRQDLESERVRHFDLNAKETGIPALSSILVKESTGERTIVSINARQRQVEGFTASPEMLEQDLVMVDGHQMAASIAVCTAAHARGIPCVLDGGSWKDQSERLLPVVDFAICSENFHPPGCSSPVEAFRYLERLGVPHMAMSRGEKPLLIRTEEGVQEVPVTAHIEARDTTGAGDILHGAFCYFIMKTGGDFPRSITLAAEVASFSCKFIGTRRWMREWSESGR